MEWWLYHLWVDRVESKGENRMTRKYTAELWRPLSCCLWPYWMSHSQGTRSPFRAWINGSWLDFRGLLCCFCLLWHLPLLCEVSVLLPDKGTTSSDRGREKWEDRNWGRGDHWKGPPRLNLLVLLRFLVTAACRHRCTCVFIYHSSALWNSCMSGTTHLKSCVLILIISLLLFFYSDSF